MNWTYSIDPNRAVVLVVADGLITQTELECGAEILMRDPGYHPDICVLMDFSGATDWEVSADGLVKLATHAGFSGHSQRAFVVPEGLATGMFNFFEVHAPPGTVKVFRTRDEAIRWLSGERAGSNPPFEISAAAVLRN